MFNPEHHELNKIINEELVNDFVNTRLKLREEAKKQILKVQSENKKYFDKERKAAIVYALGDLVAIQRTQFGTGLKVCQKYLGPYEVTKVKRLNRYDVKKIGYGDGPAVTSTAADMMKPWVSVADDESSEADD